MAPERMAQGNILTKQLLLCLMQTFINIPFDFFQQRYFILEKGSLMYAKRSSDLARNKPHGSVDLGLSVISAKRRRCRIDIDAEVFIYHIKVRLF